MGFWLNLDILSPKRNKSFKCLLQKYNNDLWRILNEQITFTKEVKAKRNRRHLTMNKDATPVSDERGEILASESSWIYYIWKPGFVVSELKGWKKEKERLKGIIKFSISLTKYSNVVMYSVLGLIFLHFYFLYAIFVSFLFVFIIILV